MPSLKWDIIKVLKVLIMHPLVFYILFIGAKKDLELFFTDGR